MSKITVKISYTILILFLAGNIYCQKSNVLDNPDLNYKLALDYFNKQKYVQSQEYFEKVINYYGSNITDIRVDAEYYYAICAIELFHNNCEYLITEFITHHKENPRTMMAYFQMGRFKYREKKYKEAISWFQKVDKYELTQNELEEYYFKLGYSNYLLGNIDRAEKLFFELQNGNTPFASPAIYYYSHLAYENKNYETALAGFSKLKDDETFSLLVPYYIAQIYYINSKYEKAIEYAEELAQTEDVKREAEINRIIGESYFRLEKFEEALPYLVKFKDNAETYSRKDIFQLAYVYYKNKKYEQAAKTFSLVTNVVDSLAQNAYYHIGDCYLQLDDKNSARLSFANASRFDFIPEIKEDAMFNYAKLTYELSFSAFNETIDAFKSYLNEFPNSPRKDEAYDYLLNVFISSKNYKEALNAIDSMEYKTPSVLTAYQRMSYYRGLELYNNLEYSNAIEVFNKSIENSLYNRELKAKSLYWRGESYYKLTQYDNAINDFKDLLVTPGAFSLDEYNLCYYNIGYCYYKKKNYKEAAIWYRKFNDNYPQINDKRFGNAFVRTGDCYFISKDYRKAVEYYAKVDTSNSYDKDYALFQEGFSYGLLKNNSKKAEILIQLLTDSTSKYIDDALFELANSYIAMDSSNLALNAYKRILKDYTYSSYIKKSLVQIALLEYNLNYLDEALSHYKVVISNYPGSSEAQEALIGIKNVYVEMNNVDAYFSFVQGLGDIADISESEQDKLTYEAAENVYMAGNCNKSHEALIAYINKFPAGSYTLNAKYYMADCYHSQQNVDSAILLYEEILSKHKNTFTEQTLISAANIYFNKKEYSKAYEKYLVLEQIAEVESNFAVAKIGQMNCAWKSNEYDKIILASKKVLNEDKIEKEIKREARYLLATSYRNINELDSALTEYRILAFDLKSKEGSEAQYYIASILNEQGKTLLAEKEIFNFVDAGSPHQYWLAKSFFLLANLYLEKDDAFQAKATLQSIIDNYDNKNDGIIDEANTLLKTIMGEENKQFEKEDEGVKIEFNEKDKDLFIEKSDSLPSNENINE